ncbi:hypothetical protein [Nocardioides sp. SYSU D00038]|uniref:hypothetical protein n=1 Tax=Nocardioides sp. SYSU D00038 TaxID=2812554 RepID=UPI0019687218|nr:hypothetical protein [Nocardioides sp. SYSU D00038]
MNQDAAKADLYDLSATLTDPADQLRLGKVSRMEPVSLRCISTDGYAQEGRLQPVVR